MKHLVCDLTGADLSESEASTLVIRGPLALMLSDRPSAELHLGKAPAAALARWLGRLVDHPALEVLEGPADRTTR